MFASQIALPGARTDRGGWSRTRGQGQDTGGAGPNTTKHRGRTGKGRVEMSCRSLRSVSRLVPLARIDQGTTRDSGYSAWPAKGGTKGAERPRDG